MSFRTLRTVGLILMVGAALGGCKSGNKSSGANGAGAKVNPAAVQARAKLPPPANATQRTSIGNGKTAIGTANSPSDTDSFWVEQIDIDGDGDTEMTSFLWDDEDRVLYAYAETEVPCIYGGTAVAAVLVGVNAAGNSRGRAEGSGFYVTYLDATECGAEDAGLFGAKFDANGNVTMAGAAILDGASDTITIVTVNGY